MSRDAIFCFACRHFARVSTVARDRQGKWVFIDHDAGKTYETIFWTARDTKTLLLAWNEFRAVVSGCKKSIDSHIDAKGGTRKLTTS